jgi:hypothetical protein
MMCVDSSVVIDKQIKAAGAVPERLCCRGVVVFVLGRQDKQVCRPTMKGTVKIVCAGDTRRQ